MSTSPNTQKAGNLSGQTIKPARYSGTGGRPGLILLKGLVWLALIVGALVALAMNYDVVWDVLVGTVFPALGNLLELAEGVLDSFYVLVGLGGFAAMATAYTGFVLVLAIVYLISRKAVKIYKKTQTRKEEIGQVYVDAWNEWFGTLRATASERWTNWWNGLEFMDKVVAGVFIVLIGIPVALLLSYILGSLVASLF